MSWLLKEAHGEVFMGEVSCLILAFKWWEVKHNTK